MSARWFSDPAELAAAEHDARAAGHRGAVVSAEDYRAWLLDEHHMIDPGLRRFADARPRLRHLSDRDAAAVYVRSRVEWFAARGASSREARRLAVEGRCQEWRDALGGTQRAPGSTHSAASDLAG